MDYTNPINNINYETINNLKNKEILINNENAHLLVEKSALEKNLKKHSMFINALSWKKFNSSKKKPLETVTKSKGLSFRTPLDNIHPIVDNNKNIQNALCHGTKGTSLTDGKRNLDIARNSNSNVNCEVSRNTNITAKSYTQVSFYNLVTFKCASQLFGLRTRIHLIYHPIIGIIHLDRQTKQIYSYLSFL